MAGSEAEQFSAVEKAPDHLQDDIAAAEVGGDPETSLAATSKTQVADPEASKCDPRVSMPFGSAILSCWVDYAGLAVLQPALPFYLAELGSDVDVVMWNGIILTGQFIAVVFGNIFWGRVVDKISSRNTLLLTMAGDAITFFITAFVREPWLLLVVRVFAGFSTPLTGALIFIFERAKSPMHALKGVSLFTLAVTFGYLTGGILVGAFYDVRAELRHRPPRAAAVASRHSRQHVPQAVRLCISSAEPLRPTPLLTRPPLEPHVWLAVEWCCVSGAVAWRRAARRLQGRQHHRGSPLRGGRGLHRSLLGA